MTNEQPENAAMPRIPTPGPNELWRCRFCGARNVDNFSENCVNCGRDFIGNAGTVPKAKQPHRPALRGD